MTGTLRTCAVAVPPRPSLTVTESCPHRRLAWHWWHAGRRRRGVGEVPGVVDDDRTLGRCGLTTNVSASPSGSVAFRLPVTTVAAGRQGRAQARSWVVDWGRRGRRAAAARPSWWWVRFRSPQTCARWPLMWSAARGRSVGWSSFGSKPEMAPRRLVRSNTSSPRQTPAAARGQRASSVRAPAAATTRRRRPEWPRPRPLRARRTNSRVAEK